MTYRGTKYPVESSGTNGRSTRSEAEQQQPVVSAPAVTDDGSFFVKWKRFDGDNFPRLGERVVLKLRGVIQHETYELDHGDDGFGCGEYFWTRYGLDDCPGISNDDEWIPLSALMAH